MQYTRPATWDDVKQLARYLTDAGAEYALVGGYAIAAHGFNRFSEDIDILVNPSAENSRRWIAACELASEADVFADDKRYAIRINDEFTVDVMPSIAGLRWEEMRPHITHMDIDGTSVGASGQSSCARMPRNSGAV
jgi:Nucleotidyl transferase AbiEii toxin, Type IV TA system